MGDELKIGDLVLCETTNIFTNDPDVRDIGTIITMFQNAGREWHAEVLINCGKILLYNVKELSKIHIEDNI